MPEEKCPIPFPYANALWYIFNLHIHMGCFFLSSFIRRVHNACVSFVHHLLTFLFPNVVIYMHYSVSWTDILRLFPTAVSVMLSSLITDLSTNVKEFFMTTLWWKAVLLSTRELGHRELKVGHGKKRVLIWSAWFVIPRGDFLPDRTDRRTRASAPSCPAQSSTFA